MEPKKLDFISLPRFQIYNDLVPKVQFSNPLACHHEIREVGTSQDGVRDVMCVIRNMKINKGKCLGPCLNAVTADSEGQ